MISHIAKDSFDFKNRLDKHCPNGTTLSTCAECLPRYQPHPEILTHPFLPRLLPPKILNLSGPPLYEQPPSKFWKTWLPPFKCTFVQKSKESFFKKTKDFISNNEIRTHLNVET